LLIGYYRFAVFGLSGERLGEIYRFVAAAD
jgi:hypothetical protein